MRTVASRLGELLESRGQVTREQLLRALRNQKVLGGRLGTCLLEIEAISEEQLCAALADQLGLPCTTPEELRGIPDEVLELLPAKVAKRCQAIAFQGSATQVKVALVDAKNLAHQDEISFVVGKRIRWYVAPEIRLVEALEKHYGEECPARLAKLLDKMNRSRFLWAREHAVSAAAARKPTGDQLQWDARIAGLPPADSPDSRSSVSLELPHFEHVPLDLPTVAAQSALTTPPAAAPSSGTKPASAMPVAAAPLATPASPAAPPPPPPALETSPAPPLPTAPGAVSDSPAGSGGRARSGAGGANRGARRAAQPASPAATPAGPPSAPVRRTVDETERRLVQPRDRDDVAGALLDFAAGLVPRTVLFVVRKGEIAGWLSAGSGIDATRLKALRLRLEPPSVFHDLQAPGSSFHGKLPALPAHVALRALFVEPPLAEQVVLLPVKVRDRLVAVLLLEPLPAGGPIPATDLADLQRVVAKAEIAFELCIMQAKLRRA